MNTKRNMLGLMGGVALSPLLVVGTGPVAAFAGAGPQANYFPNLVLQSHEGKKLRFYDDVLRGKIVVINMMYTVCTGICPGNTANLLQVQQMLGNRLGRD
uniref:SCO family protein n=1 Tax=Polaromonas sp. TaxID=1869339 RepID=UPI00286D034A